MDTHNPTQWCLIATLAVLYSIYATGRFCGSPEIVEGSLCRFRRDVGFPDLVVDRR